mmetsp:Transcript_20418/g.29242  ORF Transcript_20418/g.29242 Transcript_20418/m.29242 type:complete len:494 (-) Transcript_20418:70-1551(-)
MPESEVRRRRIFPHLSSDEAAAKESDKNEDATNEGETNEAYDNAKSNKPTAASNSNNGIAQSSSESSAVHHHLLPLPLVLVTLLCSGLFWVMSFRDAFATGQPLLLNLPASLAPPSLAEAELSLLEHTKSQKWFHDDDTSKAYWKSSRGGLGSIRPYTSDDNDMGGLFVRKMAGVAAMGYHTTKLWSIVFQSAPMPSIEEGSGIKMRGASWSIGHYDSILTLAILGNVCVAVFYMVRIEELRNAGAEPLVALLVMASLIEALVFGAYLLSRRMSMKKAKKNVQQPQQPKRPAQKKKGSKEKDASSSSPTTQEYNPHEDPNSIPSRIAFRTVLIVSSTVALISIRDLFFAGSIIPFIPRDDIYLEWTGAFFHSPPPDTVEADEYGLESPLYAGDKLVSQLLGMYLVLGCVLKFASVGAWSKGNKSMGPESPENVDRHGVVSSKMIWKAQALGNGLLLFMLRMFAPAAKSASLDLRWHLMTVAYEMIILGLYGFH